MEKIFFKFTLFIAPLLFSFGALANDGLNLDMAVLKMNKELKTLNNEILSLKGEIELLIENQRLNSEKINELLQMIELNRSNNNQTYQSTPQNLENKAAKLFTNGKNSFVLGNYKESIELFLAHLASSPSPSSIIDTNLWLGRAYFYSGLFLESREAYLEYQLIGESHAKFADSLFELSRVQLELNEKNNAKLLLTKMVNEYPNHPLISKASTLLQSL